MPSQHATQSNKQPECPLIQFLMCYQIAISELGLELVCLVHFFLTLQDSQIFTLTHFHINLTIVGTILRLKSVESLTARVNKVTNVSKIELNRTGTFFFLNSFFSRFCLRLEEMRSRQHLGNNINVWLKKKKRKCKEHCGMSRMQNL